MTQRASRKRDVENRERCHGHTAHSFPFPATVTNITAPFNFTAMSLGLNYSSDEEEILNAVSKDAFVLSSLPMAKKPRIEEPAAMTLSNDTAPHVLSEVRCERAFL